MKLTRRVIDEAAKKLAAGNRERELLWDDEIAGFGVRLTKKGGAYFLNYRNAASVERRLTLGTLAELTIEQARRKAAETRVSIRAGADPLGEIRAKAAAPAAPQAMTLKQLFDKWRDAGQAGWSKRTYEDYGYTFKRHILPTLGERPAAEITKVEIADMITAIKKQSASSAALALRTLSSCLNWAEDLHVLEEVNLPRAKRLAPPVPPRDRVPSDEEVAKLWRATFKLDPGEAEAARLIILTVLRTNVVNNLQPQWLVGNTLHIPKTVMKNKNGHQVPIAVWAMPLVAPCLELPRRTTRYILEDIRDVSRIADVDFHDLRRSFRTWCSRAGINGDHAEYALAHVSHQTKLGKTYDKHIYIEEASKALLAWQEHVRKLAGLPA